VPKVKGFSEFNNIFEKIFIMKHILGIGNALVDVITFIRNDEILEKFSLPKGSMTLVDNEKSLLVKSVTSGFKRSLASGGSAANTIHGLSMMGVPSGFIGSVGKDETGDFFGIDMRKAGVNTMLVRHDLPTGTAVALISPDHERTFATHLGAAVELGPRDLNSEQFKGYDILYLEGYLINDPVFVDKACLLAKDKKMEIAIDLASYNVVEANLSSFREIITKYADIVFANEEEARSYTGLDPHDALGRIAEQGNIAVVKTGKEGSLIRRREEIIRTGSLPVSCIDTTGAGDLYAAGFLYGYANDQPLDKCGALGALLAGHVIETVGARINDKTWKSIRKKAARIINE
jgi:sugar/nucleoside kinase (ribokinase family)